MLLAVALIFCSASALMAAPYIEQDACPPQAQQASAAAMTCGWFYPGETLAQAPVRLRFVVLRARPGHIDPTPVIHLPGGPGDSAGLGPEALARWRNWQQHAGWPHDIVLYDPRGTGQSRPRPACGDGAVIPRQLPDAPATDAPVTAESREAIQCRLRLGRATAEALGPRAQLRDLYGLMAALDIEQAHLWAISYGTRIARLFEQRHPQRVASLILDSMVPFTENETTALPLQLQGAVDELVRVCSERGCASTNPRLAVATLLARYYTTPPIITLGLRPSAQRRFRITPYRLLVMVLLSTYEPGHVVDTVQRLERAVRGDPTALRPLAERLDAQANDAERSEAVFWSVRCALQPRLDESVWQAAIAQAPDVAPYVDAARRTVPCRHWQVPSLAPPDRDTKRSSPVLVVTGQADRATPPAWSDAYMARRANAVRTDIPGAAHVPTLYDRCAQRVVAAFLRAPDIRPSPECLSVRAAQRGR